ncbi:MAG: zinc ABC transporter substrate-binding protein [Terrimicrobiaceae bacterium]
MKHPVFVAIFCVVGLCSVFAEGGAVGSEKLVVASLSTVLSDFARQVGGERVEVVEVVKAGDDPHLFEPGPGDVKTISKAKIVLANGLGFEGYLDKLKAGVGKGPVFVIAGDAVKPLMMAHDHEHHDHDHDHGDGADPHWWHSVSNAKLAVREVRDAFIKADPAGAATYQANTQTYLRALEELEQACKLEVAKLPKSQRVLVTSHDALGYFANDHGFTVLAVQGVSTSDQPSSKKIKDLIDKIKALGVKAIFAENIENPKVLEELTRETGAVMGGVLYADGLGEGQEGTYEGMVRHNVTTIVRALK